MDEIQLLENQVLVRRRALDERAGEARVTLSRGTELQVEVAELKSEVELLDRVSILLNSLGEERQLKAQTTIEELVTRGLQTIFDESLSFHIIQTTKAKSAYIDFVVRTQLEDGSAVDTPVMDARGGGLAATIGFLLRLVVMLLRGGTQGENILFLDETFAHVSDEYQEPLRDFVREVVDKTGIQILMVTHQPVFTEAADKIYRFGQIDGKTVVTDHG